MRNLEEDLLTAIDMETQPEDPCPFCPSNIGEAWKEAINRAIAAEKRVKELEEEYRELKDVAFAMSHQISKM